MVLAAEPPEASMPRPHLAVERLGARFVDQGHRALGELFLLDEGFVGLGKDVDDGIADADDIECGGRHYKFSGRYE